MNISDLNSICMGCMRPLAKAGGFCTGCGWNNTINNNQPHQLPIFTILNGKYLVGRAIGQGGFGITYVGMDLFLDTKVAIKEYYPETCVARDSAGSATVIPYTGEKGEYFTSQRDKFVGEAKLLAKLADKRSIVHVRDFFRENGTAYIVMEYIEGVTLKELIKRGGGRLPSAYTLALLRPVMEDLAVIHAQNLIHRDISPDNIIVQPNGEARLLDFGAARETDYARQKSMTVNVKHGFAPEEQYRTHGTQGPWTDVYAMCATIYHAVTGVIPAQSVDRMHEDTLLAPSKLGASFTPAQEKAVMRGLALKAEERYRSFYDLMKELYGDTPAAQTVAAPATNADKAVATANAGAHAKADLPVKTGGNKSATGDDKTVAAEGKAAKPAKKTGLIIGVAAGAVALIAAGIVIFMLTAHSSSYTQALSMIAGGDYQGAGDKLAALPDNYEDADRLLRYANAQELLQTGDADAAKEIFVELGEYKDCADMVLECDYVKAKTLMRSGDYQGASALLESIGEYKDSAALTSECVYQNASMLMSDGNFDEAKKLFNTIVNYQDSLSLITECDYLRAKSFMDSKRYDDAYEAFKAIRTYKDSADMAVTCMAYSLSGSISRADEFYSKIVKFENEFPGSGKSFAKAHGTDVYNVGCTYLGQLAFGKAEQMFLLVDTYEDAKTLCELCSECASTTNAEDRVNVLRDHAEHPSVNKALMNGKLIEAFLYGDWMKGSTRYMALTTKGDNNNTLTWDNRYLVTETKDMDYYVVQNDGLGTFCYYLGDTKYNWFRVTIIDGTHINVYVFKSDKTYELKRK